MTINEQDVARKVAILLSNPTVRTKLTQDEINFIDHIEQEVQATTKPSRIIEGSDNSVSAAIRTRLVGSRLAVVSLCAAQVGAEEDGKRASGPRNRQPQGH